MAVLAIPVMPALLGFYYSYNSYGVEGGGGGDRN